MNESKHEKRLFGEFPPISTREWEELINADLKGADFEKKLIWKTYDGIALRPFYRSEDLSSLPFLNSVPGERPFIRGNRVQSNQWEIRQDIEETLPSTLNAKILELVSRGANAVGINASAILTIQDFHETFHQVDLTQTALHFYGSSSWPDLLALFLQFLKETNVNATLVKGSVNFDPLGELILKGEFIKEWETSIQEAVTLIKSVRKDLTQFKVLNINAQHFHNGGSSLVQELAFALSMAADYLSALTDSGLEADDILASMMFTFAVGSDFFPEIGKLRAARALWSMLAGQYRPENKESLCMYIHSTTCLWNKTIFDPYVNVLRTTTETMAAAIAGSDSISVTPFDQAFKTPDEFSQRIARNQQIILQEESYLGKIVDPAAGSYYIEKLTDAIAKKSWEWFLLVEGKGGFTEAFKQGFIQEEIEKIRLQKETDIASRKTFVLGTNQYPNHNEKMANKIDKAGTSAPVSSSFRPIIPSRGSERLENIRLATERHVQKGNKPPRVFLFTIGNLTMRKARASFAAGFFGCAGYQVIDHTGFSDVEEGLRECMRVEPDIVVICSSDEEYPELVPGICLGLKMQGFSGVTVLAGYPKEIIDQMKSSGIQEFIHVRTNLVDSLSHFHSKLGIS